MWNRAELKANGKLNMKRNYWNSVLVSLIASLFAGASGASFSNSRLNLNESNINAEDPETLKIMLAVLIGASVFMAVLFVINIIVLNPLKVGCSRFFMVNQTQRAMAGEVGYAFKQNFVESLLAMALRDIIIGLGLCLFFIPGLILSYSYKMVPYILAQEPHLGVIETLKRSRAMMKGNKWNAFVFDLSFIGWHLLSILTCGILEVFFVAPYLNNATAALYIAIRDEFDGSPVQTM